MDERGPDPGFKYKRRADEGNRKDVYRGIPVHGYLYGCQTGLYHCLRIHGSGQDTSGGYVKDQPYMPERGIPLRPAHG